MQGVKRQLFSSDLPEKCQCYGKILEESWQIKDISVFVSDQKTDNKINCGCLSCGASRRVLDSRRLLQCLSSRNGSWWSMWGLQPSPAASAALTGGCGSPEAPAFCLRLVRPWGNQWETSAFWEKNTLSQQLPFGRGRDEGTVWGHSVTGCSSHTSCWLPGLPQLQTLVHTSVQDSPEQMLK